jgi:4-hydroxy-2-oxoheptanedioate aldolase
MDVEVLVRACASTRIVPLVRLRTWRESEIAAVFDTGATGIHVPRIESAEQARAVVQAARFDPDGTRGLNPFVRAASYSHQRVNEFIALSNRELVVVICVEGSTAINKLDEILDVGGVDAIFVGPYDISQSLGLAGEVHHPRVIDTVEGVIRRIKGRGLVAGVFANSVDAAGLWVERGAGYILFSVDTRLFLEAASAKVQGLHELKRELTVKNVKTKSE